MCSISNATFFLSHRAMAVPATVVYFTSYDQLKYFMGYKDGDTNRTHIPIIAGSISRSN